MGADVVEGEHALARVADHELHARERAGAHAAEGHLGEPHPRLDLGHERLQLDLGLEDRDRLAADPYPRQRLPGELQFHLDAPGAVQRVSLDAAEVGALAGLLQQTQLRQIGAEQTVRVAAHRVLVDAERRTEHARLGEVIAVFEGEREHEIAGGPELRGQGRQALHVGLQVLEWLGAAYPDKQARAGRAHDAQRYARIEAGGVECQGVEYREALAVVELAADLRRTAADGDTALGASAAHLDVDDAGLGLLALPARRVMAPRQHVLRGHRRMADEAGLAARREEAG